MGVLLQKTHFQRVQNYYYYSHLKKYTCKNFTITIALLILIIHYKGWIMYCKAIQNPHHIHPSLKRSSFFISTVAYIDKSHRIVLYIDQQYVNPQDMVFVDNNYAKDKYLDSKWKNKPNSGVWRVVSRTTS